MKKLTILCVDDEQMILNTLESLLKAKFGNKYAYEFAESAEEALELIEELPNENCELVMIVSDQIMPAMKGDELLIDLHQRYPRVIKILLTGHAGLESAIKAINQADLYRYLEKPWQDQDFLLTIEKGLQRYHLEMALRSERASLAQKVEEQTKSLSEANADLIRIDRLKDDFLAGMSHELRTPLTSILGMAEALREGIHGSLNEAQKKSLHIVEESGRHLLSLINDILDLSRVGVGKLNLDIEPLSVEAVCNSSLQFVIQLAHEKEIELITSYDPKASVVMADKIRLKQMLINLLSNAIKFTKPGGKVGLEVIGDREREAIHFTIWDTGIGIEQDDFIKLFEPFTQIKNEFSKSYQGTGLGLPLVSKLAELHRGGIAVESKAGEGSRFTISLVWSESLDLLEEYIEEEEEINLEDSLKKGFALIIENSPIAADQISRYFSELGWKETIYPRGEGVLQKAKELKPDIILLDLHLPSMSGWEVIAQLQTNDETKDIPVIIMSVVHERARAIAMGAAEYLLKPISRNQFRYIIKKILIEKKNALQSDIEESRISKSSEKPLVLVAEDNDSNLNTMADFLQASGYDLVIARNGAEAIEQAEKEKPNIILMDIQMPGMDGLQASRRLRSESTLSHIPIIAVSALAMPGDRERCIEAGANEYIRKPISLKNLVEVISGTLQKQEKALQEK